MGKRTNKRNKDRVPNKRLIAARQAAGYKTAIEAAAGIGEKYSSYSQWENGYRNIRPEQAKRVAERLGVSPHEILPYDFSIEASMLPVQHHIVGGGYVMDAPESDEIEYAQCPPSSYGLTAYLVHTFRLAPAYYKDDILFAGAPDEEVGRWVGRPVIATLGAGDGLLGAGDSILRILGAAPGGEHTLTSIEDGTSGLARVASVRPIQWVDRREMRVN